jgi:diphosphomevalonate decarboxylase
MAVSGQITWRSPSNIALVKYWGKKGFQLPGNPSVSMTLENCYTETFVEYRKICKKNSPSFNFLFQGEKNKPFEHRISLFLNIAAKEFPGFNSLHLDINSRNSFPHSAGVASSASALSALALCICSIEKEISGNNTNDTDFFRKASYLARLGSGSAGRSVYGGWVLWGATTGNEDSSDEYAIPINHLVHKKFRDYYNAILIVNSGQKLVTSNLGHKLMDTNPYKELRANTGQLNTIRLINALKNGNEKEFRNIVEYEAANLHAMFLTSNPCFILVKPDTLNILNKLQQFRNETHLEFSYTLDAGPNIHVLYPGNIRREMLAFIQSELVAFCENRKWLDDKIGRGPEIINYK